MPQTEQTERHAPHSPEEIAMEGLVNAVVSEAFGAPLAADFDVLTPIRDYLQAIGQPAPPMQQDGLWLPETVATVANSTLAALVVNDPVIAGRLEFLLRFCINTGRDYVKADASRGTA